MPRRRDTASFLMFAVVGRSSCVHEARRCLRATNRHGGLSHKYVYMREVSVGRRGLSGNGMRERERSGRQAGGQARPQIGINKPVSELISVSAARDVTRLIEIGTCYTSSHTDRCPTSRRCLLTGGGGCAPAPPYTRAVPPAPKNFPCMRGSGPLSSRGTHSAFSQEQSVTSEPSTGLERCRAASRRAHRVEACTIH